MLGGAKAKKTTRQPGGLSSTEERAGPGERNAGAKRFGWDDTTTDVDALWSRSRELRFAGIDTLFNPQQLRQPRDLSCDAASFVF